jgi:FlaA1/EpsC-like NDP-sugar epimerase
MLKETGIIGTAGPEMIRFFFTVDEAANLVLTAFENANELHGKVLGRRMKSARMRDILDVWVEQENARYEQIAGRPGERDLEYLIGELELAHTTEKIYNKIPHFIVSFNQIVEHPLKEVLSSGNAQRLTRDEILSIINNPPVEEL